MIIKRFQQGSDEWIDARVGRVTMSHAKELLTGGSGVTRHNYLLDVCSERLTGRQVEQVSTWDMERGILLEPFALEAYQMQTGSEIDTIGLAYLDESEKISASPDGLTGSGGNGGVEIKCPRPRNHMRYLDSATAMKQYMGQVQGNMWIFGAEYWDFVSFCPEFSACPLHIQRIERDDDMIEKIKMAALDGVETVDAMEHAIRRNPRADWMDAICSEAIVAVDAYLNDGEVEL